MVASQGEKADHKSAKYGPDSHKSHQHNGCDNKFSYEFFPPKTAQQRRRFWRTIGCLETINPEFFSVTYGALGSDQQRSFQVLEEVIQESTTPITAHITCLGQSVSDLRGQLQQLKQLGIRHIVALRGDKGPQGENEARGDTLRYAEELVNLLSDMGGFKVSVAAYPEVHPQASSAAADLASLKRKFDAGADNALTQFFYNVDEFLRFRDKASALGIDALIPGILPVHNIGKVISFSKACGAQVPTDLINQFEGIQDDPLAQRQEAISHCAGMCERLADEGVDNFHFYTLNQSDLAYRVTQALRGERQIGAVEAA